ncbi:tail fiber protein [Paenibacillus sp. JX-17]|uniref:Tail fiber protein n=1 Tax=Paenibacillus lacisoli TaxID=3064525 RepID=A0ABT9CGN1_9BACL|nr:tail fiber protein [Paenibacillus sp. JX-17]MDO7908417.1 tail fiber protein [Paenibacillus sp. JX-17]
MYNKEVWKDEIPDLTRPVKDTAGKQKIDPQTGRPLYELVQEGTRITSARLNHIEGGIEGAHNLVEQLAKELGGNFVAAIDGVQGLQFTAKELSVSWTPGVAYVGGRRFEVAAGDMPLNATQGQYLYLDNDGVVKKTTSKATAAAALLLFYVATDASGVISTTDQRMNVNISELIKKLDNVQVPVASVDTAGIVKLNDTLTSTSKDQAPTANAIKKVNDGLTAHSADTTKHITATERSAWNGKADASALASVSTDVLKSSYNIQNLQREVAYLTLKQAASDRINNGTTFGSTFADSFNMTIDYTKTATTAALSAGATSFSVNDATGFSAGKEFTIYDDVNSERVTVSSVSGTTITLKAALTKAYKSGANVARTMAVADATNRALKFGGWSTQVTNTVTDTTVVNSAYGTTGNGGRKLIRLSNGWLVVVVRVTSPSIARYFYVSKDNGATFTQLTYTQGIADEDACIASFGTKVYCLMSNGANTYSLWFDATTVTNNSQTVILSPDTPQTAVGKVSLAINEAGTELHAAWTSKNSTYPNSFNIRYAKGTINADGSVTWSAAEQVTVANSSTTNFNTPSVIVKNGVAYIVAQSLNTVAGNDYKIGIISRGLNGNGWYSDTFNSGWGARAFYTSSYAQNFPSAIFVSQSINGLANGRIWVAWGGLDATDSNIQNIRVAYSDDVGATWTTPQKLTNGNSYIQAVPSISADRQGTIFIVFQGQSPAGNPPYSIRAIKNVAGVWGSVYDVKLSTTSSGMTSPSVLFDPSMEVTEPIFIYMDTGNPKVGFYGTWTIGGEMPITQNDVRFTLSNTDEVVTWVQHDAGLTVTAALNGQAMDKTSANNEDEFSKALSSVQAAEVRLNMNRSSTNDDLKITRILGGIG